MSGKAGAPRPPTRVEMSGWTLAEVREWLGERGLAEPHAVAWFRTMHRAQSLDPAGLVDVGSSLSPRLAAELDAIEMGEDLEVVDVRRSSDGTVKLALGSPRGGTIECVVIPQDDRRTLCVSSQVGCAVGCPFCATATMGGGRSLEAWEIVSQVRIARAHTDAPVSNVVFMGMGEPLFNHVEVARACAVLGDDQGAGFPRGRLVVSTSGVVPRIRPFWELGVGALALSLHATTDELRDELVPINRKWPLQLLRDTFRALQWRPRESLTIEYVMLEGVNDHDEDAERLAAWCQGLPAKVNLIQFNPFEGVAYRPSSRERLFEFRELCRRAGAFATLRLSRGQDVMAACGQLVTRPRP